MPEMARKTRVVEGLIVEILLNSRLSVKESDEACFLTLSVIWMLPSCVAASLTRGSC